MKMVIFKGELFSDFIVVYMTPTLIPQEGYIRKLFNILLIVNYDATCTICNITMQTTLDSVDSKMSKPLPFGLILGTHEGFEV